MLHIPVIRIIILGTGLNFKLDVGLYQLDQQAACQRIGKLSISATLTDRVKTAFGNGASALAAVFAPKTLSFATA